MPKASLPELLTSVGPPKKSPKPSPSQADVLQHMANGSGRIVRRDGGFWTLPETEPEPRPGYMSWKWSTAIQTVRSLEKHGWIVRSHVVVPEWLDDRVLTEAGRAIGLTSSP